MTPGPADTSPDRIRSLVRERYGEHAKARTSCCGGSPSPSGISEKLGYAPEALASVPAEADLGLGCGNPTAFAALRPGETVLDLGSGGGLDALLAAQEVGETGRVIGVDMTPEMLERARTAAVKAGVARRVEFREGTLEALPVVDRSVDVVISNCVVNLSPDKPQVFREAFRVLKPGGRLMISDILLTAPLPPEIALLPEAYCACVAGASLLDDYLAAVRAAGFVELETERTSAAGMLESMQNDPTLKPLLAAIGAAKAREIAANVWSYRVSARKPG